MVEVVGIDNTVARQVTCKSCGSILKYVKVDVRRDYDCDYTGGRDEYSFITCPCCKKQVRVSG